VHRLEALVDEPATDEATELAHDHALVGGAIVMYGMIPVAEHSEGA
jgi:hypothetical protein